MQIEKKSSDWSINFIVRIIVYNDCWMITLSVKKGLDCMRFKLRPGENDFKRTGSERI
jgi:hypothetical protein